MIATNKPRDRRFKHRRQASNAQDGLAAMSQGDVAEIFGVSRVRIHQIEKDALKKIRAAIEREAATDGLSVRGWLFSDDMEEAVAQ